MSSRRIRRQRERLFFEQNGLCYWCKQRMVKPQREAPYVTHHGNEVTLDHLDSRWNPERGSFDGEIRHVAACRDCNQRRAASEEVGVPRWVLWWRGGRVSGVSLSN